MLNGIRNWRIKINAPIKILQYKKFYSNRFVKISSFYPSHVRNLTDEKMLWGWQVGQNNMERTVFCSRSLVHSHGNVFLRRCQRWMSVVVSDTSHEPHQHSSHSSTQGIKPFKEIPGPRGLPYLGTILQYRKGMLFTTNVWIS